MISRQTGRVFRLLAGPQKAYLGLYGFSEHRQTPFTQSSEPTVTTNQYISKNLGLNRFLQKVYTTTGLSILGALGTSYAVLSLPLTGVAISQLAVGGIIASLVGLIGSSYMSPTYLIKQESLNNRERAQTIVAQNSLARQLLYGVGIVGLGLSAAPLLGFVNMASPGVIPTALGLSTAIFGGASLAAYSMPKDKMLGYGRALTGSLIGLIGLQLLGLGASFFMGPNPFSMMMLNASSYISVGLFTAFIAYDTHCAIKMYEMNQPDHLGASVQFILDFWNIFMSLLRIFSSND